MPSSFAAPVRLNASIEHPIRRGLERETLRTAPDGTLALTPHPSALGSKLAHPHITTDFSEAQLELISGICPTPANLIGEMRAIHACVYSGIGAELLWPASMPSELPAADSAIPLALYGTSNAARTKTTYRNGLGLRYGRAMQTICAVHYNVSFTNDVFEALAEAEGVQNSQPFRDEKYFNLMRNFRAVSWLVVYLFGASPAVSDSFVTGRANDFERLTSSTLHLPHATSLRCGGLGYQSDIQARHLHVLYNNLGEYVRSLAGAITEPYPAYASLGEDTDSPAQLNHCILQSEAEFYSSVRAKRVANGNHSGLAALAGDGVEYIEVRLLDIDPKSELGVSEETLHFMDTLLTWCLLTPAEPHDAARSEEIAVNVATTVKRGREPGITLSDRGEQKGLADWGSALLEELAPIAAWLDSASDDAPHAAALAAQQARLTDPDATPSAQMIGELAANNLSFNEWALRLAERHRDALQVPVDPATSSRFDRLATESLGAQAMADAAKEPLTLAAHLQVLQHGYAELLADEPRAEAGLPGRP